MNKSILVLLTTFLISLSTQAQNFKEKEGWSFSLGAGAVYAPKYLGDDEHQISIFPSLRISYEDKFFASVSEGIGYNLIDTNGLKIGPVIKYDFGREEDGESTFGLGDDTDDLRGLGDVDGSVEVGAFISYDFRSFKAKLELRQGLDSGHEGLVGEASIRYQGSMMIKNQRVMYSIGPEVNFTDEDYNEAYFGVDSIQSARSGLPTYRADGDAFSFGVGASLIIPITKKISTICTLKYIKLDDEISDSSLVDQRGSEDQFRFGIYINYEF